jgi:protein involved in polysaccharide export with SLBB domain
VILVNPYQNRVKARGEVKRPAIYETVEGETLGDLTEFFGGFTESAYSDIITVRRNKGSFRTVISVDNGKFDSVTIKSGDELEVKAISNVFLDRVTVEGAVLQPGEYAYQEGLTLSQVIEKAGGLRGDAFLPRVVVLRQQEDFSLQSIAVDLREIVRGKNDFSLKGEDLVTISSIYDLREEYTVRIEGEVLKPGTYPFAKAQTVEDLIYLAGGFKESAAKSFVEVARRINPDSASDATRTAEIFNFSIADDLSLSEESSSFELNPFDLIVVRRSPFYEDQIMIEIEGEVTFPGKYAIQSKNERISDVLKRAGGLTEFAYPKGATLIRRTEYFVDQNDDDATSEAAKIRRQELQELLERDTLVDKAQAEFKQQEAIGIKLEEILGNPGGPFDLVLKEGDVLSIPKELQTVRVRGQVLYPSNVRFDKSAGFKNYIGRAGGFTDDARKKRAYVVYANGSAERTRSFLWFKNYPKIEPGAEVIIPKRPERRKLSPAEVISITTGIGTLAVIVNNLTR